MFRDMVFRAIAMITCALHHYHSYHNFYLSFANLHYSNMYIALSITTTLHSLSILLYYNLAMLRYILAVLR